MKLSLSGNVPANDSFFSIPDRDFEASFVPAFFDNIDKTFGNNTELKKKALAICGEGNIQCLFDYALTADSQAVTESQSSLKEFEAEEKVLRKPI